MRRKEREITDLGLIEKVIADADVCHVAFADGNTPYIVALNFGYSFGEKPCIYFHCAPEGRKIEMMKSNNHVCFQMETGKEIYKGENGCDWGMKYKSVVGYGELSIVVNEEERKKGLDILMDHYGGTGRYNYDPNVFSRTIILRLEITRMTAKQA